jgi:hypothetical protein
VKQRQAKITDDYENKRHGKCAWNYMQRVIAKLKTLLAESGVILGNVLLLMGGDDSVELKVHFSHLLNKPSMPLSINSDEGHGG